MRLSNAHKQSGAMTLMVVITLVLIAALGAFYSTQSVFIDRLAGHAQEHGNQARLSAEAALAWSQAEIQRITQTNSSCGSTHVTEEPAPMANQEVRGASLNNWPSWLSQIK